MVQRTKQTKRSNKQSNKRSNKRTKRSYKRTLKRSYKRTLKRGGWGNIFSSPPQARKQKQDQIVGGWTDIVSH